jgi:NADH-quinone oxidoreductase subunit H
MPHLLIALLQFAAFAFKVFFFCWFLLLIRWTLPRFRYDQLMQRGREFMLPIFILNVFIIVLILLLLR